MGIRCPAKRLGKQFEHLARVGMAQADSQASLARGDRWGADGRNENAAMPQRGRQLDHLLVVAQQQRNDLARRSPHVPTFGGKPAAELLRPIEQQLAAAGFRFDDVKRG